ncbi:hypothetical protein FH972_021532 [Carpinus fangiana]|uniref:tRNA wybutosine-synthesizing protein 3 n=1 Tax=Carpinus fangiana TaxID=176857 RepID=A0A5N6KQ90_9ROSI|nr:hypothetical protein FH972_021532 [Carpinus fangiana]
MKSRGWSGEGIAAENKIFVAKKQKILRSLEVDEDDYADASPKGSLDKPIRDFIEEINSWPGLVTTSSCSGRVSVFIEGPGKPVKSGTGEDAPGGEINKDYEEYADPEGEPSRVGGGKGGGRWLYTSHDPEEEKAWARAGTQRIMGMMTSRPEPDGPKKEQNLVHFKFEPMILHVLTASLVDAQKLLGAAQQAGFRESGISSATSDTPMVAVRTNGLALESIVAVEADGNIMSLVGEEYVQMLFDIAERRFKANRERINRLRQSLRIAFSRAAGDNNNHDWEDANVRRQRKKAEGLERRARLLELAGREEKGTKGALLDTSDIP